jgi:hypothetical protein
MSVKMSNQQLVSKQKLQIQTKVNIIRYREQNELVRNVYLMKMEPACFYNVLLFFISSLRLQYTLCVAFCLLYFSLLS